MKILITGAAGFIGSNLCKFFLNKNFEVIGLDNFATGFEHNLISFFDNLNFKFIEGDICSVKTIQKMQQRELIFIFASSSFRIHTSIN